MDEYDYGDSVNSVELAIRKHDNFTRTLHGQDDKIVRLRESEHILADSANDPEAGRIREKYEEIMRRHAFLHKACDAKTRHLEEAIKFRTRQGMT